MPQAFTPQALDQLPTTMDKSLIFIPDISGFTEFVETTEVEHSLHVIAEILEVLIQSNTLDLQLAEVEGDALFFYRDRVPSKEALMNQVEVMFTAFYSHLKLLEHNRICPCRACSSAADLQLKIIVHTGKMELIEVQGRKKPFGKPVIEAHQLMKNSIEGHSYVLLSEELATDIELQEGSIAQGYSFQAGTNTYSEKKLSYQFAAIPKESLKLAPFVPTNKLSFKEAPNVVLKRTIPLPAEQFFEYITNYRFRHHWLEGAEEFVYNEEEVTKAGTEHLCVVNGKHLNFVAVTKAGKPGQLIYGERTTSPEPVDALTSFFIVTPVDEQSCELELEVYLEIKSPIKKLLLTPIAKRGIKKGVTKSINKLTLFAEKRVA